jgi:integrase
MLDWAHREADVPYRHPADSAALFRARFRQANPVRIAQYDANQLKRLLKTATARQRLYVYLALNCGYYQSDIGGLRRSEVLTREGRTVIARKRSKTAHQNDFEAMHTLWPETASLLRRQMADPNRWGLALLSNRGTPLYRKNPHCDIISDTYLVLQQRAGARLPFKQFRKIGSTAIQRIGGDEARRLYKAGTIDSGDRVYVTEAWEKLTPHLSAWGNQLRQDGVLLQPATV